MKKLTSIETHSNQKGQTNFRLNGINKIKEYFNSETQERRTITKKLSKYIAASKCYWNSSRNNKFIFYSFIFFNYRNNKETVKINK